MTFYVDGSAVHNGDSKNSYGGFGVVCVDNDKLLWTYAERHKHITNNIMELSAILYVMENYSVNVYDDNWRYPPDCYSDSSYCVNSFNSWMHSWVNHNWTKPDGSPPENLEIFKRYHTLWVKGYRINLQKIKGHAGHEWNELADKLAKGLIAPTKTIDKVRI